MQLRYDSQTVLRNIDPHRKDTLKLLHSMTGFASSALELPHGSLRMELRTVNHRYLEFQFRLADCLRHHEPRLREILGTVLKRGKVDCRLEWEGRGGMPSHSPNTQTLEYLSQAAAMIQEVFPDAMPLSLAEILHWPGVIPPSLTPPPAETSVLQLAYETLSQLDDSRRREGQKLGEFLHQHTSIMKSLLAPLPTQIPQWLSAHQEKLTQRWRATVGTIDEERLLQEVTLWASKVDIGEELERLTLHLDEIEHIVKGGGPVGKRLDFLMQELHREANTLGSKSVHSELSRLSLDLKLHIEQMREQIQNIE